MLRSAGFLPISEVGSSKIGGGAARGADRINHCLPDAGVASRMWVNRATALDWRVQGPASRWALYEPGSWVRWRALDHPAAFMP